MKTAEKNHAKTEAKAPYPPSFIDRLLRFFQRLPVPYWLVYILLFITQGAVNQVLLWVDGTIPPWTISRIALLFPVWQWVPLMIVTFLNKVSASTLDNYSRLLDSDDEGLRKLKYEFATMPRRGVLLNCALWVLVYVVLTFSFYSLYTDFGYGVLYRSVIIAEGLFCFAIGGVIYYHSLRQLWLINRTVKMVKQYNLFDLDPVYSFSRLTAWTGISWVLMLLLNLACFPFDAAPGLMLSLTIIQVVLALAAFVLPLRLVNRQLVVEKRRLLAEHQQRVESTLARLHKLIDQGDLSEMEHLRHAIDGLTAERNLLEKIPTLPWRTETLAGFLSATVLPIILLLIQMILQNWLGG